MEFQKLVLGKVDLDNPKPAHARLPVMVFAGSFWTGSTENGLSPGFRKLGWVVQEIDQRDYFNSGGPLWNRAIARLTNRHSQARYETAIKQACKHLRPDVLFTVKGAYMSKRTLESISASGVRTVCFWPDRDFDHSYTEIDVLLDVDLFITSKSFQMPWLAENGLQDRSAFVAHGYNPAAHQPVLRMVAEGDYTADIRYIGNHSPAKQVWIEDLARCLPEANLKVTGHRWRKALRPALAKRIIEAEEYVAASYSLAIQTARINVAVHFGKAANGWEDLVSTRTFEIPACGGFMLHIDNDEVREYYDVGSEIDVFSTPEELADKCRFYLDHDDIRRKMVARAYDRCVPRYSYETRADEILQCLSRFFP